MCIRDRLLFQLLLSNWKKSWALSPFASRFPYGEPNLRLPHTLKSASIILHDVLVLSSRRNQRHVTKPQSDRYCSTIWNFAEMMIRRVSFTVSVKKAQTRVSAHPHRKWLTYIRLITVERFEPYRRSLVSWWPIRACATLHWKTPIKDQAEAFQVM